MQINGTPADARASPFQVKAPTSEVQAETIFKISGEQSFHLMERIIIRPVWVESRAGSVRDEQFHAPFYRENIFLTIQVFNREL